MNNIYNTPQINPTVPQVPTPRSSLWKWSVGSAAVLMAIIFLIYSGGMDAVFRLFGVGASGIYEISISSTNDWLGVADHNLFIGNSDMDGVNIFAKFGSIPEDINLSEKGLGFVTSIFSSPGDPTKESYQKHEYISPMVDLGYLNPSLTAIEMVDYKPTSSQTVQYYYRTADSVADMLEMYFMPLDTTLVNSKGDVKIKSAPLNQIVKRYVQVKIELNGDTAKDRSAVYALNFQYKETDEVTNISDFSQLAGTVSEHTIEIQYSSINAPLSADVEVISGNLDNALVYSASGVNLAERLNYSFVAALSPGAYALVISGPTIENIIIPFPVGNSELIKVKAGSFASTTGQITGDLNSDGVVNSGDMLIRLHQDSNLAR